MSRTICISYNWQEPTSGIVNNWLVPSLDELMGNGFRISVDRKDCDYNDSIESFEKEIGKAEFVIAVINEHYLYSTHCMYEAALVFEKGNVQERLYLISTVSKLPKYDDILEYWENKEIEVQKRLDGKKRGRELFEKELKRINLILKYLGKILVYLDDQNRLDFSKISENSFQKLKDKIRGYTNHAELPDDGIVDWLNHIV